MPPFEKRLLTLFASASPYVLTEYDITRSSRKKAHRVDGGRDSREHRGGPHRWSLRIGGVAGILLQHLHVLGGLGPHRRNLRRPCRRCFGRCGCGLPLVAQIGRSRRGADAKFGPSSPHFFEPAPACRCRLRHPVRGNLMKTACFLEKAVGFLLRGVLGQRFPASSLSFKPAIISTRRKGS